MTFWSETRGMTLREYYAGIAMQGILAAPSDSVSQDLGPNCRSNPVTCAKAAVEMADALLTELGYDTTPTEPAAIETEDKV